MCPFFPPFLFATFIITHMTHKPQLELTIYLIIISKKRVKQFIWFCFKSCADHSFLKDSVCWTLQEMKIKAQNGGLQSAHRDSGVPCSSKEPEKSKAHVPQDLDKTNFSIALNNSRQKEHKQPILPSFVCSKQFPLAFHKCFPFFPFLLQFFILKILSEQSGKEK